MKAASVLFTLLALSLGACAKSEPEGPAEPAPAVTPPALTPPTPAPLPAPTPPAAPPSGADDVATEEDFEADSAKAINAENLDAHLDALEKEILSE